MAWRNPISARDARASAAGNAASPPAHAHWQQEMDEMLTDWKGEIQRMQNRKMHGQQGDFAKGQVYPRASLMGLPPVLRNKIYLHLFTPEDDRIGFTPLTERPHRASLRLAILQTCVTAYVEASCLAYSLTPFSTRHWATPRFQDAISVLPFHLSSSIRILELCPSVYFKDFYTLNGPPLDMETAGFWALGGKLDGLEELRISYSAVLLKDAPETALSLHFDAVRVYQNVAVIIIVAATHCAALKRVVVSSSRALGNYGQRVRRYRVPNTTWPPNPGNANVNVNANATVNAAAPAMNTIINNVANAPLQWPLNNNPLNPAPNPNIPVAGNIVAGLMNAHPGLVTAFTAPPVQNNPPNNQNNAVDAQDIDSLRAAIQARMPGKKAKWGWLLERSYTNSEGNTVIVAVHEKFDGLQLKKTKHHITVYLQERPRQNDDLIEEVDADDAMDVDDDADHDGPGNGQNQDADNGQDDDADQDETNAEGEQEDDDGNGGQDNNNVGFQITTFQAPPVTNLLSVQNDDPVIHSDDNSGEDHPSDGPTILNGYGSNIDNGSIQHTAFPPLNALNDGWLGPRFGTRNFNKSHFSSGMTRTAPRTNVANAGVSDSNRITDGFV